MKICQYQTMFHFQETRASHFLEALINVSAGRSRLLYLLLNVNQSDFIKNLRQEGEWKSVWLCAYDKEVKLRSILKWLENFIICGMLGTHLDNRHWRYKWWAGLGVRLMSIYWKSLLCKMRNKVPSVMSGQVNSASKHSINRSTNS